MRSTASVTERDDVAGKRVADADLRQPRTLEHLLHGGDALVPR